MDCPHCRSDMRQVVQDGVGLHVCDACGGLWLDAAELRKVVDQLPAEEATQDRLFSEPELTSSHACPRCDGSPPLLETGLDEVPDLELDTCKSCEALFVTREEAEAVGRFIKWQQEEPDGLTPLRSARLLTLLHAAAEAYGPGGDDRPSWSEF